MKQQKTIAFVGLVLLLTGLVVTGLFGYFTKISAALCIMGIAAGSVLFIPRVTSNRWLYLNMTLYSVLSCGAMAMFFLLLQRHPAVWDGTHNRLFSVSPVTQNFLAKLQDPVRASSFIGNKGEKSLASLMLNQYSRYSPNFSYGIYNPYSDLAEASRFGMNVSPGETYLERLTTDTKKTLRIAKVLKLNEQALTNAVVQLLRDKDVTVYFVAGHREIPLKADKVTEALTNRSNLSNDLEVLVQYLENNYINAQPLELMGRDRIPADASLIVMAGPKSDLSDPERQLVEKYLDQGGRVMFWLNPDVPQIGTEVRTALTNVGKVLGDYGVQIPAEVVTMPLQTNKKNDLFDVPAVMAEHRITRFDGTDANLTFVQVRPVTIAENRPQNTIIEPLVTSPKESYNVPIEQFTRMYLTGQQPDIRIRKEDLKPETLAVAVTRLKPGASEDQAGKMVVVGNASCLSSRFISQGSLSIFLNAVNWLTDAGDLIAIPEPAIENTPVELTAGQQQFLFVLLVIAVPSLIGLGGLGYAISRRGHLSEK